MLEMESNNIWEVKETRMRDQKKEYILYNLHYSYKIWQISIILVINFWFCFHFLQAISLNTFKSKICIVCFQCYFKDKKNNK